MLTGAIWSSLWRRWWLLISHVAHHSTSAESAIASAAVVWLLWVWPCYKTTHSLRWDFLPHFFWFFPVRLSLSLTSTEFCECKTVESTFSQHCSLVFWVLNGATENGLESGYARDDVHIKNAPIWKVCRKVSESNRINDMCVHSRYAFSLRSHLNEIFFAFLVSFTFTDAGSRKRRHHTDLEVQKTFTLPRLLCHLFFHLNVFLFSINLSSLLQFLLFFQRSSIICSVSCSIFIY